MNVLIGSILIVFISTFITLGQSAPNKISLLVLQCKTNESTCNTQEIVKYNFINGELNSKTILLNIDKHTIKFYFGHKLYNKKYLVSNTGYIIDIERKKFLGKVRGSVLEVFGDEVIVKINNVKYESGIFKFSLINGKYEKIPSPNVFELDGGKFSPNKQLMADWNGASSEYTFAFYNVLSNFNYLKQTYVKGFYISSCSIRCSGSGKGFPFVWLDNNSIITQKYNGKIIQIFTNGLVEEIFDLDIKTSPDSSPYFSKNDFGDIHYHIGGETYLISVNNKSFQKNVTSFGNGFLKNNDDVLWKTYSYKNKPIGKFRSSGGISTNGYLATYYLEKSKYQGYYDGSQYWDEGGVKVWNAITKDWTKIEAGWGVNIIGWIEE